MKTGVIDVGGGLRGAYGAGVFAYCIDLGIRFDYTVGISAGSANVSSYLAGQRDRNYKFYTEYSFRKEYMSMSNFMHDRNYIGLDYIYSDLSDSWGEYPLDYEAVKASGVPFYVVVTDANTGHAVYFNQDDMDTDDYGPIKASCAVPVVNRPYVIDGVPYYDGGISDPIPLVKCFDEGCDRVVLILTRPRDYERASGKDELFAKVLEKDYPKAAAALRIRAEMYNTELALAKAYEKLGKVLIVAPDDIGKMKTLTKDKDAIIELYLKGFHDAEKIREWF